MAAKVQIHYEEMEQVAKILAKKRDDLLNVLGNGDAAFRDLEGKWQSPAATQFFNQTGPLLERFAKLSERFEALVVSVETIAATLWDIEDEAKSQFNWLKDLSANDSASGSSGTDGAAAHPAQPDVNNAPWQRYVGKTSSDQIGRAQGCVAYVLDTTYVPWVSDVTNIAPGNAKQWEQKALDWVRDHPDSGITVDDTPRPGSIATWTGGGSGFGHVGKVESVDGNEFTVSSGNTWRRDGGGNAWGRWYGQNDSINSSPNITTYSGTGGARFIHFPWEEL